MRRLMKGKRRKSESPSDADSEENGDSAHQIEDAEQPNKSDDNNESAPKSKRKTSRGKDKSTGDETDLSKNDNEADEKSSEVSTQENGNPAKGGDNKRRKKEDRKPTTSQDNGNSEQEYEVEKIISRRTIKGRRQFLVRWKGYDETSDTWENEKDLNCEQLIEDFMAEENEEEKNAGENDEKSKKTPKKTPKSTKKTKKAKVTKRQRDSESKEEENDNEGGADEEETSEDKSPAKRAKKSKAAKQQNDNEENNEDGDEDEEKEFEVEKILDVHFKKNKSREFLIRWKGFSASDDTWEPEANLNCPDLITKFMDKVEKARSTELRELRTNPSHTKRYTLTMHNKERRLSRRNLGKERVMKEEENK
ncbi:chromo domain-containing protein cec-1 isoform X1 [Microplitis demolitor]|uniref:chromo domain-containing protein cec-1 isoform X1 n=1 Tax=Microplitis demolitor TaxID=69319 RepID=UPI0004CC92D5|nr:chromo domain-containing protein cec-1 isoform X1 [Microplitis demolitor]